MKGMGLLPKTWDETHPLHPTGMLSDNALKPDRNQDTETALRSRVTMHASTPRRWGYYSARSNSSTSRSINPTKVGILHRKLRQTRIKQNHPHIGGEQQTRRLLRWPYPESSPHGWGTGSASSSTDDADRIIPHRWGTGCSSPISGDSGGIIPTWVGNRTPLVYRFCISGINPTYVGNIGIHDRRSREHENQPHVCGEHNLIVSRQI